jgi:hypothetical protein
MRGNPPGNLFRLPACIPPRSHLPQGLLFGGVVGEFLAKLMALVRTSNIVAKTSCDPCVRARAPSLKHSVAGWDFWQRQPGSMPRAADLDCGAAASLRQHQNRMIIRFWVKMNPCGSVPGV